MPPRAGPVGTLQAGRGTAITTQAHDRLPAKSKQASYREQLSTSQTWYDKDPARREFLAKIALELVSACPAQVHPVCDSIIKALASGAEDDSGGSVRVGGREFRTRNDLKAECQQLLKQCEDNAHLGEEDARFILELLSYHPRGAEKSRGCQAISAGVHPTFPARCFYVVRAEGREDFSYLRCVDNAPTEDVLAQQQICEVLCAILQLHPSACEKVARSIEEQFPPYFGRMGSVERHRNWAQSILMLCSRIQQLSEFLLMVLIRRMVEIDAAIHKMEEELPDPADQPDQAAAFGDKRESGTTLFDHMAQILDANMMLMFEFLQRRLTGAVGEAENQLAKTLFSVFEGTVLLTHKVRCVQFLWFYLSSLRPAWAEAFLSVLLQTAYSPAHGMARRLISFAYLASFVSRAQFLNTNYALRTAQYISTFALENLHTAESHVANGDFGHPHLVLFLAAVQAMCYMLCFRAASFAQDPVALNTLLPVGAAGAGPEAFTPVLESPCRPLARISYHVAKEFCRSIKPHSPQIAAIARQQLQVPVVEEEEPEEGCFQGEAAGLEAFFPFDPYRLRHSSMYLSGLYQNWVPPPDETESELEAPGGFHDKKAARASAAGLLAELSGTDEENSDADFTDTADVAERGFVPSVRPSPAFRPRSTADMIDVSPLCVPMEGVDDEDAFALPQASVDAGSSMLSCLLSTPAYKAGRNDNKVANVA